MGIVSSFMLMCLPLLCYINYTLCLSSLIVSSWLVSPLLHYPPPLLFILSLIANFPVICCARVFSSFFVYLEVARSEDLPYISLLSCAAAFVHLVEVGVEVCSLHGTPMLWCADTEVAAYHRHSLLPSFFVSLCGTTRWHHGTTVSDFRMQAHIS